MMLQVFHFLTEGNANAISRIHLASTAHSYSLQNQQAAIIYEKNIKKHKKYQDKKVLGESVECKKVLTKCKKDLIITTLTFSLGLLNFIFKRIGTATTPINLSNDIVYSFNLSDNSRYNMQYSIIISLT